MDADDILLGTGKQAEGIMIPQVAFPGKGQATQVLQGTNIPGLNTFPVEGFTIEGDMLVDPPNHSL